MMRSVVFFSSLFKIKCTHISKYYKILLWGIQLTCHPKPTSKKKQNPLRLKLENIETSHLRLSAQIYKNIYCALLSHFKLLLISIINTHKSYLYILPEQNSLTQSVHIVQRTRTFPFKGPSFKRSMWDFS